MWHMVFEIFGITRKGNFPTTVTYFRKKSKFENSGPLVEDLGSKWSIITFSVKILGNLKNSDKMEKILGKHDFQSQILNRAGSK